MIEKFKLMYYENECGYIEFDKLNNKFKAVLYEDAVHVPFLLFGFDNLKIADDEIVRMYFDDIVIPESRENIKDILKDIGLDYYNKWEIYKKLEGRNTFDDIWIKPFN